MSHTLRDPKKLDFLSVAVLWLLRYFYAVKRRSLRHLVYNKHRSVKPAILIKKILKKHALKLLKIFKSD